MFQFENFRVRKLTAINALNFYITLCMAFLAHMSMKSETHALKVAIIQKANNPIRNIKYRFRVSIFLFPPHFIFFIAGSFHIYKILVNPAKNIHKQLLLFFGNTI